MPVLSKYSHYHMNRITFT